MKQNIVEAFGQSFTVPLDETEASIRAGLENMNPAAKHAKCTVVDNGDGTKTFTYVESVGVKG